MSLTDFLKFNKKVVVASSDKIQPVREEKPNSTESRSSELKPTFTSAQKAVSEQGMNPIDVIAPKQIEVDFDYLRINNVYFRTMFITGYPRFVSPGWLEQVINFNSSLDISFFIYPVEGKGVLDDLMRKVAEMEAEIYTDLERGKIVDPATQAKLDDAKLLQQELVKGSEHFFQFGFYISIRAADLEQLNYISKQVESTLGSLLIGQSHATLDMDNGFLSTAPLGLDTLSITRNMDTTSLATTFPLTSTELSGDTGVLYGINPQNGSFIIFDRFSLENANMTIFATSGAGKTVRKNEPVIYQDLDGSAKLNKIGVVVEKLIKEGNLKRFDKEAEGVIKPGIKVFTFDNNLKGNWSNVTVAARKKSPKSLYKITTRSGREISTTADHNFVVLKSGELQVVRGGSIKNGGYIPLPRKTTITENSQQSIDVWNIMQGSKLKLVKKSGRVGLLRRFNKKTSLPVSLNPTSQFFELLGHFTSEGCVSKESSLITTTDPDIINSISKYYKRIGLSHGFCKRNGRDIGVYVSAQIFSTFLKKLGVSGKAGQKRVPSIVFSSSSKQISSFLKAYFEGDGGVENHEISATTKSKGLASDLSYLLFRFGIIARIGKTRKYASNTVNKVRRTYYRIRVSGQDNIRKYIKQIGFISYRKNNLAKKLLKKGNTNIDTIPELGTIFNEIYEVLYKSSEIPAPKKFSEIKLGIFKPSPKNLLFIIKKIGKRIKEFEDLEKDGLSTLNSLPVFNDLINEGRNKAKNKLLWKNLGHSWQTMRAGIRPYLFNTLQATQITHSLKYTSSDISGAIYRSFKNTGESLKQFDKSLWESIVIGNGNPQYDRVIQARNYISAKYQERKNQLMKVKEKLHWLNTLALSDLYWDEIVSVKKINSKDKYVYDLQVENEVFLAGHGGMFIHNSYFVKLECLRSLMLGTEVIVIDPEGEYKSLCDAVDGQHIEFSFTSPSKINPFDLSQVYEKGESHLGLKILSLHALFKVIMGEISPIQEALLDRAIVMTYKSKGITQDPETQVKEPPLMEDLYKILVGMETPDAMDLAARIEKFVKGSFVGIFDQQTNISIDNPFTVFGIRELSDALRPIAMFIILDFIWTRVKKDLKPRLLVVDEAWHMMRYKDSAQFLWSIVKRARKYYLGLTTITQDVDDFLAQDIGKAIVTNSALRALFKQSPAAIDKVGDVFYLSQGERNLLLGANVGEGIFFAGVNHTPISVVASPQEHKLMTTKPQEVIEQEQATLETQPGIVAKMIEEIS